MKIVNNTYQNCNNISDLKGYLFFITFNINMTLILFFIFEYFYFCLTFDPSV